MKKQEESLTLAICRYLQYKYPDVIYRIDYSAGVKMSIGSAVKLKKLNNRRGYPDLTIFEKRGGLYGALFIELKKEGTKLYKKNGDYATEHIKEQAEMLTKLTNKGYCAYFGIGSDKTKEIIDKYLKL